MDFIRTTADTVEPRAVMQSRGVLATLSDSTAVEGLRKMLSAVRVFHLLSRKFQVPIVYTNDPQAIVRYFAQRPTGNRALLRAAITALESNDYIYESSSRLIVRSDSAYLIKGFINLTPVWMKRQWITSAGKPIMNQDLWQELLRENR